MELLDMIELVQSSERVLHPQKAPPVGMWGTASGQPALNLSSMHSFGTTNEKTTLQVTVSGSFK